MDFWEAIAKDAPQYLPIIAAIAVIIFTRTYVYKGMVPESMLQGQIERERAIVEGAKDIENRLEEIVRQLEALTRKVSEEVRANTERLASLEHCMSDYLTEFNELNHNFELHRKGVPPTEVFRKPRQKEATP